MQLDNSALSAYTDNYLSALGEYKALFTATVATIAAYYGLWRFQVAADQNRDRLKQDRFIEWRSVLEVRFAEIDRYDPFMRREFVRVRLNLFNQLHDINFSIDNNQQLTAIFQNTFRDLADFFETQNNRHIGMGGVYPNNTYSYSFDSFRFLLFGSVDNVYPAALTDLQTLYLAAISPNRIIDPNMYQTALRNYRPN